MAANGNGNGNGNGVTQRPTKVLLLGHTVPLTEQLDEATATAGGAYEVHTCTRLADLPELIDVAGPFDVLIAGPKLASKAGLARVKAIREELSHTSVILAFHSAPDADLSDLVRAGAVDLIKLPADPRVLVGGISRAADLARSTTNGHRPVVGSELVTVAAAALPVEPPTQGRVFTIASASGGCGKTFLATNMGWFLHHYTGKRVCIIDLDLQFGEVSTALRLRPRYAISDLLSSGDERAELAAHIDEYTEQHATGVHVLAAPRDPTDADRISTLDVRVVIEAVRSRFDYVVVDTPPALSEPVLAAFDLSDELQVMATLDLPSIRNLSVFLGTLDRLKVPKDNIRLILNKAESDVGIDVSQVARLFPQGFDGTLPYAREVSKSINVGSPVLASAPDTDISRLMTKALARLLPPEVHLPVEPETNGHRRWPFPRRSSQKEHA